MEAAAVTVLPHLGNVKHSPKIHIKRPRNKSNLSYRVVVTRPRELFWEAAEDKCSWSLGNTVDNLGHGQKCQAVRRAGIIRISAMNWNHPLAASLSVWGEVQARIRHILHRTLLLRSLMEFLCQNLNSPGPQAG